MIGDPDPEAEPGPIAATGATGNASEIAEADRHRSLPVTSRTVQGYLLSGRHSYIYLFDIATKKLERLTKSKWDESFACPGRPTARASLS